VEPQRLHITAQQLRCLPSLSLRGVTQTRVKILGLQEYVEPEDIFDRNPKAQVNPDHDLDAEDLVDIMTEDEVLIPPTPPNPPPLATSSPYR